MFSKKAERPSSFHKDAY